ncbi:hypothetical protein CHS0354_011104 [Potamilus streckersoni]|uniref:Uncharacterized protein n=1 Tax=Potamilus streckersoni TaxID=2493646 RepID=A0AAE0TD45_9BIVA|nr:hypothetical protein CHS0354_011104 [Potamilus streckersoni]
MARENVSCLLCKQQKHKHNQTPFEELELYLRMGSRFLKQYNDYLLPSLRYFWPRNVLIVVILDEESAQDKELAKSLAERYPYPRTEYQSPIDPGIYHGVGHERMQRDYFYPENNTNKTYVGYLDTDSVFVTRVIPDLLFEEGKPIVIANYGKRDTDWWSQAAMTTEAIFKSKEVMKCMAYFPVIMKVSHIVELRGYLEKLHNKPFDEIYRQFSVRPIGQFNIMCQYIWAFHKDEYKFHFHLWSYNNGSWQGEDNSPGRQPYEFYLTNVTGTEDRMKDMSASIKLLLKCVLLMSSTFPFFAGIYLFKSDLWNYIMTPLNNSNASYHVKETQAVIEDLELYLRMSSKFLNKYDSFLLPSLRYFWPGNVSIVVVLDAENAKDKELGKTLPLRYPYPRVEYQSPIHPSIYHHYGHERMQRDFFYAEEKIRKRYVGYIDTDTVFVTRVIPELLFEMGKPVVIGNYGPDGWWWSKVSVATASMFKSKEVMRCMAYFPVIMKVSHIVELRKYMEKLHNKSFDEIYKASFSKGTFSQFSVMCQYIWMFHRDEYKFYFHLRSNNNNGIWHGEGNSPGRQPYEFYQTNVSDQQKVPKPRAAIHYRYHRNWTNPSTLQNVIKAGICFSGGFDLCPDLCKHLNRSGLQRELYCFEYNDWSWDQRCLDEQRKHYQLVTAQTDDEAVKSLKAGCINVDHLTFKP